MYERRTAGSATAMRVDETEEQQLQSEVAELRSAAEVSTLGIVR